MKKLNTRTTQYRKLVLRREVIAKLELERDQLVLVHGAVTTAGSSPPCNPTISAFC